MIQRIQQKTGKVWKYFLQKAGEGSSSKSQIVIFNTGTIANVKKITDYPSLFLAPIAGRYKKMRHKCGKLFAHFFAGDGEGGEQECDYTRHPDGPHPPDVPTKSHPGTDQTPRQQDTQTNQTPRQTKHAKRPHPLYVLT